MPGPLISVALPVFNGSDYLTEAVESILAQDFADFELVIADNASTDRTSELARRFAASDQRVRVDRSASLVSQVANVNRAADLCHGEWIQFFCHDDVMAPGCLGRVAATAKNSPSRVGLIGHGTGILYNTKCFLPWGRRSNVVPIAYRGFAEMPAFANSSLDAPVLCGRENIRANLLHRGGVEFPALTNACIRRAAFQQMKGFDDRFIHFDTFGWFRLLLEWDYIFLQGTYTLTRLHGKQVAVMARKKLRSVHDHELFWREFFEGPAKGLLSAIQARFFTWIRVTSIAAGPIAMELLQRKWRNAANIAVASPVRVWPMLPLYVLRTFRAESRRISHLRRELNLNEIYP